MLHVDASIPGMPETKKSDVVRICVPYRIIRGNTREFCFVGGDGGSNRSCNRMNMGVVSIGVLALVGVRCVFAYLVYHHEAPHLRSGVASGA